MLCISKKQKMISMHGNVDNKQDTIYQIGTLLKLIMQYFAMLHELIFLHARIANLLQALAIQYLHCIVKIDPLKNILPW